MVDFGPILVDFGRFWADFGPILGRAKATTVRFLESALNTSTPKSNASEQYSDDHWYVHESVRA